jgi:hypothetical protein
LITPSAQSARIDILRRARAAAQTIVNVNLWQGRGRGGHAL